MIVNGNAIRVSFTDADFSLPSGGGPSIIAPGHTGAVTTPNTDSNYKPDFQDLDSVEWARTAINGLAMRGMISGRDQYTFDPNANITRAEYCQILMGAINALATTFGDCQILLQEFY